jgi:CRP-like cAMP-binding protein
MTTQGSLQNFFLFHGTDSDDLVVLEAHAERKHCLPAEVIFREGEEADAMYFVELGTVRLVKVANGVTVLVTVGSGGSFGAIAFFDRGRRPATALAQEASHLIRLPFTTLAHVLEQRPPLAQIFYRNACALLAKRFRRTLIDLSFAHELNEQRF